MADMAPDIARKGAEQAVTNGANQPSQDRPQAVAEMQKATLAAATMPATALPKALLRGLV